jgi:hypothetical protein
VLSGNRCVSNETIGGQVDFPSPELCPTPFDGIEPISEIPDPPILAVPHPNPALIVKRRLEYVEIQRVSEAAQGSRRAAGSI